MKKSSFNMLILVLLGFVGVAHADKKSVDLTKTVIVRPFENSVKGASGLPEAVRSAVVGTLKDEGVTAFLTAEEAKDKGKTAMLELTGRLVDFAAGNAAKRLMVGFGSGRAHAGFEFTMKDAATGETVWQKTVKQTASFWFNGTTSSSAERSELPEGVARKLVQELKKER